MWVYFICYKVIPPAFYLMVLATNNDDYFIRVAQWCFSNYITSSTFTSYDLSIKQNFLSPDIWFTWNKVCVRKTFPLAVFKLMSWCISGFSRWPVHCFPFSNGISLSIYEFLCISVSTHCSLALFDTKLVSSLIIGSFFFSFLYIYHEKVLKENVKVVGVVKWNLYTYLQDSVIIKIWSNSLQNHFKNTMLNLIFFPLWCATVPMHSRELLGQDWPWNLLLELKCVTVYYFFYSWKIRFSLL